MTNNKYQINLNYLNLKFLTQITRMRNLPKGPTKNVVFVGVNPDKILHFCNIFVNYILEFFYCVIRVKPFVFLTFVFWNLFVFYHLNFGILK